MELFICAGQYARQFASNFSSQNCGIGITIIILQMIKLSLSEVSPLPKFTPLVNQRSQMRNQVIVPSKLADLLPCEWLSS